MFSDLQLFWNQFSSCFISLHHIVCSFTLHATNVQKLFFFQWRTRRKLQRIVASSSFYGKERNWFYIVVIKNSNNCFSLSWLSSILVCFAKVLCIIKVSETKLNCKLNAMVSSKMCDKIRKPCHRGFCIVQYFEILNDKRDKMDMIDKL